MVLTKRILHFVAPEYPRNFDGNNVSVYDVKFHD